MMIDFIVYGILVLIMLVLICLLIYMVWQIRTMIYKRKQLEEKRRELTSNPLAEYNVFIHKEKTGEMYEKASNPNLCDLCYQSPLYQKEAETGHNIGVPKMAFSSMDEDARTIIIEPSKRDLKRFYRLEFLKVAGQPSERVDCLVKAASLLGRRKGCDIYIEDSRVSREHAEIIYINGELYIQDIGSTNGTVVDGYLLIKDEKVKLNEESVVQLGETVFRIKVPVSLHDENQQMERESGTEE